MRSSGGFVTVIWPIYLEMSEICSLLTSKECDCSVEGLTDAKEKCFGEKELDLRLL
jgi:hypothetical protein